MAKLLAKNAHILGICDRFTSDTFYALATTIDDITAVDPIEQIPIRERHRGKALWSLRRLGDADVQALAKACATQNYFRLIEQAKQIIARLEHCINTPIEANARYYRARIGVEATRPGPQFGNGRVADTLYTGFRGGAISAPPLSIANEGRLNRAKVSALYAASDSHTALCEVRPHPGHFVSIAEFACQRDLRSANFADTNVDFFLEAGGLGVLRTVTALGDLLSDPVPPEQKDLYLVTQMIGDAVRDAGFDVIVFKSSVGKGTNVVFFDGADCQFVPESEWVEKIDYVTYGSTKVLRFSPENEMKYHVE